MDCIKCGSHQVRVIDTRAHGKRQIYRRRVCMTCGKRWSTIELPVSDLRRIEWRCQDEEHFAEG